MICFVRYILIVNGMELDLLTLPKDFSNISASVNLMYKVRFLLLAFKNTLRMIPDKAGKHRSKEPEDFQKLPPWVIRTVGSPSSTPLPSIWQLPNGDSSEC